MLFIASDGLEQEVWNHEVGRTGGATLPGPCFWSPSNLEWKTGQFCSSFFLG